MVKFGKRGNERANDVLSGGEDSVSGRRKASRRGAVVLAVTLFLVAFALVLAATFPFRSAFTVALAVVAGLALAGSVHIAYEWERAVVLRFGRFHRLAGPGLYVTIPVVDSVTIVIDQRISSISCSAEQVLGRSRAGGSRRHDVLDGVGPEEGVPGRREDYRSAAGATGAARRHRPVEMTELSMQRAYRSPAEEEHRGEDRAVGRHDHRRGDPRHPHAPGAAERHERRSPGTAGAQRPRRAGRG